MCGGLWTDSEGGWRPHPAPHLRIGGRPAIRPRGGRHCRGFVAQGRPPSGPTPRHSPLNSAISPRTVESAMGRKRSGARPQGCPGQSRHSAPFRRQRQVDLPPLAVGQTPSHVDEARDATKLERILAKALVDLVILDVMLLGADGLSICRRFGHPQAAPIGPLSRSRGLNSRGIFVTQLLQQSFSNTIWL